MSTSRKQAMGRWMNRCLSISLMMVLAVAFGPRISGGAAAASASTHTVAPLLAKAKCKTVVKKVKGKKKKTKVCPKPAQPTQQPIPLTKLSGTSPFVNCTDGAGQGLTNYPNTVAEPRIAVNSKDPRNVVVAWMQDIWNIGGAKGVVVAATKDGGKTWKRTVLPVTTCGAAAQTGLHVVRHSREAAHTAGARLNDSPVVGTYALDVNIVFVPNTLAFRVFPLIETDYSASTTSQLQLTTSTDGGFTFGPASAKISIPKSPNKSLFSPVRGGPNITCTLQFTDVNKTSQLDTIVATMNGLSILPTGAPAACLEMGVRGYGAFHVRNSPQGMPRVVAQTSTDAMKWNPEQTISTFDPQQFSVAGLKGVVRSAGSQVFPAIDQSSGAVYVVWQDARFNGGDADIVMSRSTDGVQTWQPVQRISDAAGKENILPTIGVNAAGVVGVMYTDFQSWDGNAASVAATTGIKFSKDGGATWTPFNEVTTFDFLKAPQLAGKIGHSIGTSESMATAGTYFYLAVTNGTDVYMEGLNLK